MNKYIVTSCLVYVRTLPLGNYVHHDSFALFKVKSLSSELCENINKLSVEESGGSVSTDERSFDAIFEKRAASFLQELFGCFDFFAANVLPALHELTCV